MSVFDLIMECARIPSFSSYEDKPHPFIEETVRQVPSARMERVPEHNIVIEVPGNRNGPVIALTAHLDKINHFGGNHLDFLEVDRTEKVITGQLDDAAGVGICLCLLQQSRNLFFSPINDYVMYGRVLNHNHVVPCLALEPAIWPYHEIGEKVNCADVEKVASMLENFLASVGNGLLGWLS